MKRPSAIEVLIIAAILAIMAGTIFYNHWRVTQFAALHHISFWRAFWILK